MPVERNQVLRRGVGQENAARVALGRADQDQKLRRALLRRYAGENEALVSGQICFYWRDARAPDLMKIRWRGPARVILREDDDDGKPMVYWVAHGSQLLRCAPHHVRPDFRQVGGETSIGGLESARRAVSELKSRGVTRFIDLNKLNKRRLEEVDTDEEGLDDDDFPDLGPPRRRPRLDIEMEVDQEELPDTIAELDALQPSRSISPAPTTPGISPVGQDAAALIPIPESDVEADPPATGAGHPVPMLDEPPAGGEPPQPPAADGHPPGLSGDEPEPNEEPSIPPSARAQHPEISLDPETASLYEPSTGREDFAARRLRYDRQETMQFGPTFSRPPRPTSQPYENPLASTDRGAAELPESYSQVYVIEDLDGSKLPPGWKIDEAGYMVLTDEVTDFWEVKSGCLIRHHVQPRHGLFNVMDFKDVPIDPQYLDPVRVSVMKMADGRIEVATDDGSLRHRRPQASLDRCDGLPDHWSCSS